MKRNMMFFLCTVLLHSTVASALEVELVWHEEIAQTVNRGASLRAECPAASTSFLRGTSNT
jgi:hypothetical protein